MLSTFIAQVLTDPQLNMLSTQMQSKEEFERLQDNWGEIKASQLKSEFQPERWLQADSKPSGLLTFRYAGNCSTARLQWWCSVQLVC